MLNSKMMGYFSSSGDLKKRGYHRKHINEDKRKSFQITGIGSFQITGTGRQGNLENGRGGPGFSRVHEKLLKTDSVIYSKFNTIQMIISAPHLRVLCSLREQSFRDVNKQERLQARVPKNGEDK